jgi:hypothetical protein
MEIYRKNSEVSTEAQANQLLDAMDDFVNNPSPEKAQPCLDYQLMIIWNNGERLEWEWNNETLQEYVLRKSRETAKDAELDKLKKDNSHFLAVKIRPWRDKKLQEWVDITYMQGQKYAGMTPEQITERENIYQELLDWPALENFETYKTDAEIDALKPSAPSYLI